MTRKKVIINNATKKIARSNENNTSKIKLRNRNKITDENQQSDTMQSISRKFVYIPKHIKTKRRKTMDKVFKKHQRTQIAELRPVTNEEVENPQLILAQSISISKQDLNNGSPKIGDMIARNPKNHDDTWLVAKDYYEDNFKLLEEE